ncbi:hypothetical protein L198_03951 [Cryptococcus wingfieldii CBS 7118]|uniref:MARVEL domain-containing protein n=1 Tax=Cryptococcus wingfieldii CBS 7118 TaxID=1295528 RepID=A0A1E3J961_9TREE|nr:hypothetical protein L198_03951 [Cryptococcus wingfieldii CBS 7118]ODN97387.1 hypothetical protein L198_03951 [Cryptococcus wingfieldii CBS 7118]
MPGNWLRGIKGLVTGLLLASAFCSFIIDIIMILKVRHYSSTYPPAVVALIVCSILEWLYVLMLMIMPRSNMFRATSVAAVIGLFTCFSFACIVATTVLRHHSKYCDTSLADNGDLCGVLRGTEGLGWMLFGFNLIYLCLLPVLASGGHWSRTIHELPYEEKFVDEEKAPAH